MLADLEPHNIQALIDAANDQLEYIGVEWDGVHCSVYPDGEF